MYQRIYPMHQRHRYLYWERKRSFGDKILSLACPQPSNGCGQPRRKSLSMFRCVPPAILHYFMLCFEKKLRPFLFKKTFCILFSFETKLLSSLLSHKIPLLDTFLINTFEFWNNTDFVKRTNKISCGNIYYIDKKN